MNVWYGKAAVIVSLMTYIAIRWPHGLRSGCTKVTDDRKGGLEIALLTGAWLGTTILPLLWILTELFAFADYRLQPVAFGVGVGLIVSGEWLFFCSHRDLGRNWSVTLQMREDHQLVTSGIYARIRHPMYAAMFVLGIAQLFVLPNWLIGPTYLLGFGAVYVFRVAREERMMRDHFGGAYDRYLERTGRLFPRW